MDATAKDKLKELVTAHHFQEAEILLNQYLLQSPNDYALLMHMAGVQSSMFNYSKAEEYYKRAIQIGKRQSGSAKVQLMRIYSQQCRYKDLIALILKCLEDEEKSITLKEQLIQVFMTIFEYKSALIYSRQLIEQLKSAKSTLLKTSTASQSQSQSSASQTEEQKKASERAKVLSDPMKQSDLYLMHSQILNKVGRFSDSIIYCKKAIATMDAWISSLSTQQRNQIITGFGRAPPGGANNNNNNKANMAAQMNVRRQSMEYHKRMNRYFGYLGLCYLHIDDVDNALQSFQKAKNINAQDRIAHSNIYNITQNRGLFDKCLRLKAVYDRYVANKLTEEDQKLDLQATFIEYIQLLIQQNRLFLAKQICNNFLTKSKFDGDKAILGYHTPKLVIIYEDILRQTMNDMTKHLTEGEVEQMEQKRNSNGPQAVINQMINDDDEKQQRNQRRNNDEVDMGDEDEQVDEEDDALSNIQDLPSKIWELRAEIDSMYEEAIKLSPNDTTVHIAYALCLWRIGYNAEGIESKTNKWSTYNKQILEMTQYHLARANAFINEDNNKQSMDELQRALKCCGGDEDEKKGGDVENVDEKIQTRLLMAVTYNKMNQIQEAKKQCEYILNKLSKTDEPHEGTLKMYAAILQRMKRYTKSKQIYTQLLQKTNLRRNETILTEYVSLLIDMREYDEAKQKLQMILSMNPENPLPLMYEFGVICYKMKDFDKAEQIFNSVISQDMKKKFDAAYKHLAMMYQEQTNEIDAKLHELVEDTADSSKNTAKLEQEKKAKQKQIEKCLRSWINANCYNEQAYYMFMDYLWSQQEYDKLKLIWNGWIKEFDSEYNQEFEGTEERKDNMEMLHGKKKKSGYLLSNLYQKYARLLTQHKVISKEKRVDTDDEETKLESTPIPQTDETPKSMPDLPDIDEQPSIQRRISIPDDEAQTAQDEEHTNEEIEGYFSKSLEYHGNNVEALQGFAAYYISQKQYIHALPFLERANSLNQWSANTWIQLSRLCQTLSTLKTDEESTSTTPKVSARNIPNPVEILKGGVKYIEQFEYKMYHRYLDNMVKICEELVDKLILYGGDDTNNIELAEKYCWLILNKLDKLNMTALRDISKLCTDREKITAFFESLLSEFPNYCPALVEYAQFLTTSKDDRVKMLSKADSLLDTAIKITDPNADLDANKNMHRGVNAAYRCVALYMKGFVKLHQIEKNKGLTEENKKLNDEARQLFLAAVKADENNIYARINLAQFLAFKDNDNEQALAHLEYAYNNVNKDDPNLIANLIKVLAKKSIENVTEDDEDDSNVDIAALRRAFALCGTALRKYHGHFGLIVARSSLQSIKKKFGLMELDDGLDDEEVAQKGKAGKLLQPQTTYGMIGVDIMNTKNLVGSKQNDAQ